MRRAGLLALVLLLGGFLVYTGVAEPVRREVLKELRIDDVGGCQEITTELQFPIAMQAYTPHGGGALLMVRVIPLLTRDLSRDALASREALVPERDPETALREVSWEGDAAEGPQLVFQFSHGVSYEVRLGEDFRSVVLTLYPDTRDPAPCRNGRPVIPQGPRR